MITCKSCYTEYEDGAAYCNHCDISLLDDSGQAIEEVQNKKEMSRDEVIQRARKITANVHKILAALYFIYVFLILLMYFSISTMKSADDLLFALLPLIPMLIHLLAWNSMLKEKPWARPFSIVIALFLLLGFPIGTICGAIILYQMFRKEWTQDS